MKARAIVLIVGIVTILGIGGYAAWKSPWVKSLIPRGSENKPEMDLVAKAELPNVKPPESASGSPQWRGASRLGVAPAGKIRTDWDKTPPKELWRSPIGGGYGSCSVVNGKIFVQDKQGGNERVVCLDAETGKLVWEYSYPVGRAGLDPTFDNGPRATPTIEGNTVYTFGGDGKLHALETDGTSVKLKWKHDLMEEFGVPMPHWGFACSPLILGEMVIVQPGGNGTAVMAFDKNTGHVKWKTGSNPQGYSSPVAAQIGGEDTIFAFMGDALLAIRPIDGKVMDSFSWKTDHAGNIATPIVVKEYVFISSAYGMGCALLRAEKQGDEVKFAATVYDRRGRAFQNHHATSVYKDKHLFGINGTRGSNGLQCISFDTGLPVEDWEARGIGEASIILAGDHLILQSSKGDLYLVAADPKEYNQIARIRGVLSGNNNWASPILVDGRLYLRDEQNVVCLDVRP